MSDKARSTAPIHLRALEQKVAKQEVFQDTLSPLEAEATEFPFRTDTLSARASSRAAHVERRGRAHGQVSELDGTNPAAGSAGESSDTRTDPAALPREGDHSEPHLHTIGSMISMHRDWRIETSDIDKSVVFQTGPRAGGQMSPVSGSSARGAAFKPAFLALAAAIEAARRKFMVEASRTRRDVSHDVGDPRSFAINVEGVRCRVQRVQETRFHVRVPSSLLPMNRLGMPETLKARLLSSDLDSGGLVVICGGYGSGKTNTVNAIVRERIDKRGGYALVMGNPIEYEYAGLHGSTGSPGFIEQISLEGLDMAAEIRSSMRNFPSGATSTMAYPELIGHEGVGEMLRSANRGNLVFADMHALNLEASILNLVSMGEQDGERYSRELLGNTLRLVVHQKMAVMPDSRYGVIVSFSSVVASRGLRAALVDINIPLSKVLTQTLATET